MSSERETKAERNARLRSRILGAAAPGCLVVLAAVTVPGSAQAATPTDVDAATGEATPQAAGHTVATTENPGAPQAGPTTRHPKQWWHNGWARPWGNWNNWQNWPNWHNWHNWGRGW